MTTVSNGNKSILLSPPHPLATTHHPPSISSSDSTTSSTEDTSYDSSSQRRIRFAPLPVPQRLSPPPPSVPSIDNDDPSIATPTIPPATCPTPSSPRRFKSKTHDSSHIRIPSFKSKSWLKPFLKRPSSSSSTNSPLSSDHEELTPISLHPSSRSRESSEGELWGIPLGRWTSTASAHHRKSHSQSDLSGPFSLSRTQSAQSYNSDLRSGWSKNGRKGTHLLNGRVYGGRRTATAPPSPNPFANISDEADSEFVEWGYGGMGSVKSGGGGMWKRVQSENNGVIFGSVDPSFSRASGRTKAGGGGGGDDGDDGSGMAWVKKRREQREREKREQEEKEKLTKEQASQDSPPVVPNDERPPRDTPIVADARPPQSAPTSVSPSTNEEHHVLRAVTVPFQKHVHHLRGNSVSSVVGSSRSPSRVGSAPSSRVASVLELPSGGGGDTRDVNGAVRRAEEGDDDEGDDDDYENESETGSGNDGSDDDEEEEKETRKTALGAGVEKISRHQDKV